MRTYASATSVAIGALLAAGIAGAASAQEVRIYCDDTGFGCQTMQPVADRFNAEHPGMTVNLELVNYQNLLESLPVQLASGEGPDGAMISDLGGLSRYYLDLTPYVDADRFNHDYERTLRWLRGLDQDSDAINGMPTQLTVNGAYVNLTLFEQAGVPVPEEGATWEEWAEATRKVAEATGTDFAMEMDRSGHRFASLAISYGAELVGDDGRPAIDDGLRKAVEQFVAWHDDGTMPMDLWGAVGGATHRELFSDFLNADVVFYFGGSWTLNRLDKEIGDLFDWEVAPAPCGPSSCTVMPGGNALVAFKSSQHPEVIGAFIDYLSQPENLTEVLQASVELPAARTLQDEGIEYPGASKQTQDALKTYTAQVPKMADAAYRFQGWRYQRAMMNALTTRISQVLNHELDVDAALERVAQDVNLAIDAAESN
ncbi:ABC transporter substrate-binding protein [Consotaella aegiceratis]|uniref:ABC transporter substrate-binding protein n=1 Tax=Consotaella aegiceratis TaxID=3097961 RepID=UPI002F3FB140